MVTRRDVALKAGVSTATVSHVINGTKYVSPDLKQKVEEVIRLLNYKPNMIAQSLSTKATKHVGIVVSDITNPYYGEITIGMEEMAGKEGYTVSLYSMNGNRDDYFASIMQRQLDGLFITTAPEELFTAEQIKNLAENKVALVNSGVPGIGSELDFNYKPAVDKVIKYLTDLNHRYISFLSGLSIKMPNCARYNAYMESLKKYGLDYNPEMVVDGEYPFCTDHHSGYIAMKKLLDRETRVTAVLATNDLMALGAVKAIRDAGLNIPDDISVVGCDDVFFSEYLNPPLTTIRAPKKEMGRVAMQLLLKQIKECKTDRVFLDMDLVIRNSTGKASEARR